MQYGDPDLDEVVRLERRLLDPVVRADDVVLLTFRIVGEVDRLRSSVWVRDSHLGWRLRFHQGTRAAT